MLFTAWGKIRGCCYHIHHSEEAAWNCIKTDAIQIRQGSGMKAFGDRQVRVIESAQDLETFTVTHGPGRPLRSSDRKGVC